MTTAILRATADGGERQGPSTGHGAIDAVAAARAALTVGGAILVGATFAALVRIALPRALGPTVYGGYRLAESAAEVVLLLLTLGLDTTLRRDIAHDPTSAAQRLWDVIGLRARAAFGVAAVVGVLVLASGASTAVLALFAGFAAVQALLAVANAHVAALHATGDARWPARLGVAVRGAWTLAALALLAGRWHPLWIVAALVLAEASRLLFLHRRSVRRIGAPSARGAFVWTRAWGAATASLAVFVNYLAHNLYARLGTWTLGVAATADAVAWYASAANVAALALLGMPLVTWILLPSAAGASRAGQGRDAMIVAALRAALLGAVPVAGAIVWGATPVVALLFGAEFAPAVGALRALAPTIALAYLSTIAAVALLERRRERAVAAVSLGGLLLAAVLTIVLVHRATTDHAAAAAVAMLGTEILVTAAMLALAWRPTWTRPVLRTLGGVAAAGLVALVVDGVAAQFGAGLLVRGTLLAITYGMSLPLVGAVGRADLAFLRTVLRRPAPDAI
jgi:O-antigen/teichoic acid export membrane protein